MKQLLSKLLIGLCLATVAASASTINCADQTNGPNGTGGNTLDKYIALGSAGCYIDNELLFSNFAYTYTMGTDSFYVSGPRGTGTPQPATSVTVAVNALNDRFEFGANWVVNHYQTANLSLSFTVTAPAVKIQTLQNLFVATQGGAQNGGPTRTTTAICTGSTCASTNFTNGITAIPQTSGPILITNTVVMNARGSTTGSTNNVHLSIIQDQFAHTAPATAVPEPMTYLFTGAGLAGLALLRRRKQA